jgi:aspartyl-tRNA(Asn)/glutamyl-tRNA(Gln) amidotransferase subunit B
MSSPVAAVAKRLLPDARAHGPAPRDRRWPDWQVVLGVETHAQIRARRKLFSRASLPHSIRRPDATRRSS